MPLTHLSHSHYFAIGTPSCFFEILRYLCCFAAACLSHDYHYWVLLDQVEETITVSGDWE